MVILQVKNLIKEYGVQTVLNGVTELIEEKDKIGLVGPNGAGKSTLLKIIAGISSPDGGEISWLKSCKIGYLEQQGNFSTEAELFSEVLSVFKDLLNLRAKIRQVEKEMSLETVFSDPKKLAKKMEEYDSLSEQYKQANGYSCESKVRGVLKGLGFSEEQFNQKISTMSGGQQRRVLLAKLLLTESDLLLLDEPTNHLDLEAIEWLEGFLRDFTGAVIVISHDRYFLNNIATKIWDLEEGKITSYQGNYDQFVVKKKQRLTALLREYDKQQERVAKLNDYIRKNQAGVNARQARGRKKMLERMKPIHLPSFKRKKMGLKFTTQGGTGNMVRELIDVGMRYNDKVIFSNLNLLIRSGERIGLVGPNGAGKTTLCKIVSGDLTPTSGRVVFGQRVKVGYYSQTLEHLPLQKTILDFIREAKPLSEEEARNHLGKFLFSNDDVFKTIGSLSGGEQSRVALAHLVLGEANFLILDEPTNHLDIQAQEVLENALKDFSGTVLTVSHNRYFLDQVTEKIIELKDGKLTSYLGNYTYYKQKKNEEEQLLKEQQAEKKKKTIQEKNKSRGKKQEQFSLKQIEEEIMELEQQLAELAEILGNSDTYLDSEKVRQASKDYEATNERLAELYNLWEQLM